jgi:hypothetical protein
MTPAVGRARRTLVGLAGVAALALAAAIYVIGFRSTSASDLGAVNSVAVQGEQGRLCVNDSYDENHCRNGNPLILPRGGVEEGECVEMRTRSRSDEIVVVRATADPCFTLYDG